MLSVLVFVFHVFHCFLSLDFNNALTTDVTFRENEFIKRKKNHPL